MGPPLSSFTIIRTKDRGQPIDRTFIIVPNFTPSLHHFEGDDREFSILVSLILDKTFYSHPINTNNQLSLPPVPTSLWILLRPDGLLVLLPTQVLEGLDFEGRNDS
jgi:hypothetical protein